MVKPQGVWVVAACFDERAVITSFIERVLALPGVDRRHRVSDSGLVRATGPTPFSRSCHPGRAHS